jgi:hypothetical protein
MGTSFDVVEKTLVVILINVMEVLLLACVKQFNNRVVLFCHLKMESILTLLPLKSILLRENGIYESMLT